MICTHKGIRGKCRQEVMPKIDKDSKSMPHYYESTDKVLRRHWGFPTYHNEQPLCYYHEKIKAERIEKGRTYYV